MEHKDALTDLIEFIQSTPSPKPATSPSGDRQVVNSQGETITLGYDGKGKISIKSRRNSLELYIEEIKEKISQRAYEKIIELIGKENLNKPVKLKLKIENQ
jgi:hypothetical protein